MVASSRPTAGKCGMALVRLGATQSVALFLTPPKPTPARAAKRWAWTSSRRGRKLTTLSTFFTPVPAVKLLLPALSEHGAVGATDEIAGRVAVAQFVVADAD